MKIRGAGKVQSWRRAKQVSECDRRWVWAFSFVFAAWSSEMSACVGCVSFFLCLSAVFCVYWEHYYGGGKIHIKQTAASHPHHKKTLFYRWNGWNLGGLRRSDKQAGHGEGWLGGKVEHPNKNKFCFHLQTRFAFVMNNRKPAHYICSQPPLPGLRLSRLCCSHSSSILSFFFFVLWLFGLVCFVLVRWWLVRYGGIRWKGVDELVLFWHGCHPIASLFVYPQPLLSCAPFKLTHTSNKQRTLPSFCSLLLTLF